MSKVNLKIAVFRLPANNFLLLFREGALPVHYKVRTGGVSTRELLSASGRASVFLEAALCSGPEQLHLPVCSSPAIRLHKAFARFLLGGVVEELGLTQNDEVTRDSVLRAYLLPYFCNSYLRKKSSRELFGFEPRFSRAVSLVIVLAGSGYFTAREIFADTPQAREFP